EKHLLHKFGHQRRKLEEELAWFDRYLFGKELPTHESLKDDSPLAWALKKARAKRAGGRYGLLHRGVLIPETVRHGKLQLGRFEVTCAQYAAFDRNFKVEPGREDHPAPGMGCEQAKAYCAWLTKLTGRTCRLPRAGEADDLYGTDEKEPASENTLDRWAGYAVNPDDAVRLRALAAKLPGQAPLLRAVGA